MAHAVTMKRGVSASFTVRGVALGFECTAVPASRLCEGPETALLVSTRRVRSAKGRSAAVSVLPGTGDSFFSCDEILKERCGGNLESIASSTRNSLLLVDMFSFADCVGVGVRALDRYRSREPDGLGWMEWSTDPCGSDATGDTSGTRLAAALLPGVPSRSDSSWADETSLLVTSAGVSVEGVPTVKRAAGFESASRPENKARGRKPKLSREELSESGGASRSSPCSFHHFISRSMALSCSLALLTPDADCTTASLLSAFCSAANCAKATSVRLTSSSGDGMKAALS